MAVTTSQWESLFAARTRADVGDGIAQVLAFLGVPDLISFAGGFPDPLTFPRERAAALVAGVRRARASRPRSSTRRRAASQGRSTRSPRESSRCRDAGPPTTSC